MSTHLLLQGPFHGREGLWHVLCSLYISNCLSAFGSLIKITLLLQKVSVSISYQETPLNSPIISSECKHSSAAKYSLICFLICHVCCSAWDAVTHLQLQPAVLQEGHTTGCRTQTESVLVPPWHTHITPLPNELLLGCTADVCILLSHLSVCCTHNIKNCLHTQPILNAVCVCVCVWTHTCATMSFAQYKEFISKITKNIMGQVVPPAELI